MFNMDKLRENLGKIQEKIGFLQKEDINEEDTKNYLIIPFFQSLGWDFTDPFSVKAEDTDDSGKRPDYGFYVNRQRNSKPKLLVEAKKINDPLRDVMINQKLIYFNTTACPFLIITNGDLYKIYYSELKGNGKEKLIIDFALSKDIDDDTFEVICLLQKDSIEKNNLEKYAREVSISNKMRKAVDDLFQQPSKDFINAINKKIKEENFYVFSDDDYKLVLPKFTVNVDFESNDEQDKINNTNSNVIDNNQQYSVEKHFKNGKWDISRNIYNKLIDKLRDEYKIIENPTKVYIGIQIDNKNIFQAEPQKSKLNIFVKLDFNDLSEQEQLHIIDVSKIGHHASMSNAKCIINNDDDINWAMHFIKKAIENKS